MTSLDNLSQSLMTRCMKNVLRTFKLHLFLNSFSLCPLVLFCFNSKSKDRSVSIKPVDRLNIKIMSPFFFLYSRYGRSNALNRSLYDLSLIIYTSTLYMFKPFDVLGKGSI